MSSQTWAARELRWQEARAVTNLVGKFHDASASWPIRRPSCFAPAKVERCARLSNCRVNFAHLIQSQDDQAERRGTPLPMPCRQCAMYTLSHNSVETSPHPACELVLRLLEVPFGFVCIAGSGEGLLGKMASLGDRLEKTP